MALRGASAGGREQQRLTGSLSDLEVMQGKGVKGG